MYELKNPYKRFITLYNASDLHTETYLPHIKSLSLTT